MLNPSAIDRDIYRNERFADSTRKDRDENAVASDIPHGWMLTATGDQPTADRVLVGRSGRCRRGRRGRDFDVDLLRGLARNAAECTAVV